LRTVFEQDINTARPTRSKGRNTALVADPCEGVGTPWIHNNV
jgi:hypothetical protein